MLKYFYHTLFFVMCFSAVYSHPIDSLGIEKRNGKIYVQHKVEKKETIYSLLKRYGCSEQDFFEANKGIKKGSQIATDQVIEIPINLTKYQAKPEPKIVQKKGVLDENGIEVIDIPEATPTEIVEEKVAVTTVDSSKITKEPSKNAPKITHRVVAGESLFTIAKKYGVKVWQLREWNKLKTDALAINTLLVINKNEKIATKTDKPTKPIKKDSLKTKVVQVQAPAGEVEKPKKNLPKPTQSAPPITVVPNAPSGRKFAEQGIAEVIGAGANTNKFLALHKTAPVGTLIKVVNQANGQSVWVKVIGKLNGGDVVIKLSPKAFEKLSPNDKRIRANINYSLSN